MLATMVAAVSLAAAPAPWEGEPFAATAAAMAQAAAALKPPEASIDILLEDTVFAVDAEGRTTETWRLVFVPRTAVAAREWGLFRSVYAPWFQERPEVKLRVVSPSGEEHWLDPATVTEGPAAEDEEDVYSDHRVLRVPLPALEAGSVVEERVVTREREPYSRAGATVGVKCERKIPVRRQRIRVEAPAGMPLHHLVTGLPRPSEVVAGGRRALSWDLADLPEWKDEEPWLPPEAARGRRVQASTAPSWRAVATEYARIADDRLAGADLAATARELVAKGDAPAAAAQKVLAWVRSRTRYTGLALGDGAIVPARPADVLQRGYGDCKDLALLVVGILRAAGLPASIALVNAGHPVTPEVPGLGQFNHAIVIVRGKSPVWLDPTSTWPAGVVPSWLQARHALVADASTTGLVDVPDSRPDENRIEKVRTITLAENGRAAVSERTERLGSFAAELEIFARFNDPKSWDGRVRERLAGSEDAKIERRYEPSGGRGLPARTVYSASSSRWGVTSDDEAEAIVSPDPLFDGLPPTFNPEKEEEETPSARKAEAWLPEAYAAQLRYEIDPPPGFQAPPLPAPSRESLGPATLATTWSSGPGGRVIVDERFELPRRRLSAAEADELRKAVRERTHGDTARARFQRTAAVLLGEGKGREALDEMRRLVALHPSEARHHDQLALALVDLGMVEAARVEARKAIALEPGSEWSQRVLAQTLEHDLLGRHLSIGCDLAGAITTQKAARDLAPKAAATRLHLAQLLEMGSGMERYGAGARLDESLAERRYVWEDLGDRSGGADHARLLLYLGRKADAVEIARKSPAGPQRNGVLVAAALASEGLDGLKREMAQLPADARGPAANALPFELLRARLYEPLGALASAGSASPGAATVANMSRARRMETVRLDDRPGHLPFRLMNTLLTGDDEMARSLFAQHLHDQGSVVEGMRSGLQAAMGSTAMRDVPVAALTDVVFAMSQVNVDGDGPWRVTLTTPDAAKGMLVLYAIREGGVPRIVAGESGRGGIDAPAALGWSAFRAAQGRDDAGARRLMEWARPLLPEKPEPRSPGSVLDVLWTGARSGGHDALVLAAAGLAAYGAGAREALPILKRESEAPGAKPEVVLARAVAAANAQDDAEMLASSEALVRADPGSEPRAFVWRLVALRRSGRFTEALALVDARLAREPDHPASLRERPYLLEALGRHDDAVKAWSRVVDGEPTAGDLNNAAWFGLFGPKLDPQAMDRARQSVEKDRRRTGSFLHTLATIQAANEMPVEAVKTLRESAQTRGVKTVDWLVLGRAAQSLGLPGDAEVAFRRAQQDGDTSPVSTTVLARRWLAALQPAASP